MPSASSCHGPPWHENAAYDADAFAANAIGQAIDADDRIIFNTATGQLSYDADGVGSLYEAIHFATLTGVPLITADDIYVV